MIKSEAYSEATYKSSLPDDSISKEDGNFQHPLFSSILKVNNLQPFLCDIEDLNKPDMAMHKLHNRAIILPFGIRYEQNDMIACNKSKVDEVKKRQTLKELIKEKNFLRFTTTTLDSEYAELHLSFNDLIIVQGIIRKLT